jgi:hypothetical protein
MHASVQPSITRQCGQATCRLHIAVGAVMSRPCHVRVRSASRWRHVGVTSASVPIHSGSISRAWRRPLPLARAWRRSTTGQRPLHYYVLLSYTTIYYLNTARFSSKYHWTAPSPTYVAAAVMIPHSSSNYTVYVLLYTIIYCYHAQIYNV